MRAVPEVPQLSVDALKQPLAYEHEVDAALFLGALDREPTETERLAAAYYLQHRSAQLTGNVALTGVQVGEKVEEMINNIQDDVFVRSLARQYRTATEPHGTLAEMWNFYKPDMSRQPRIGQVLKRAAIAAPFEFAFVFEGLGRLLSESQPTRIGATIGAALFAGYGSSWFQKRRETRQSQVTIGSSTAPPEPVTA